MGREFEDQFRTEISVFPIFWISKMFLVFQDGWDWILGFGLLGWNLRFLGCELKFGLLAWTFCCPLIEISIWNFIPIEILIHSNQVKLTLQSCKLLNFILPFLIWLSNYLNSTINMHKTYVCMYVCMYFGSVRDSWPLNM